MYSQKLYFIGQVLGCLKYLKSTNAFERQDSAANEYLSLMKTTSKAQKAFIICISIAL